MSYTAALISDETSILTDLAHDLRQPLSTIASIAFYLEMILPPSEEKARQQVVKLQQLVLQSDAILDRAISRPLV